MSAHAQKRYRHIYVTVYRKRDHVPQKTVNAGFRKYDVIAISIENLTLIGRVVCEI